MSAVIQEVNTREDALLILRKRWFTLIFLQGLLVLVSYLVLDKWWLSQYAFRWFALATIFSAYFAGILWRNLNFRPKERVLLIGFGPGNLLTILRGFLIAYLFGFLFSPWPPGWLTWSPDGGSLAIKGSLLRNGKWRVFIFDVQTGNVIYDGPFDWEGIWVEPNSPLYDWGITLPPQRRGGLEICSEPPQ